MDISTVLLDKSAISLSDIGKIIEDQQKYARKRIIFYVLLALVVSILFLTIGAFDAWELIALLRLKRFIGLVVVAVALSVATVLFQVITRNRILSPSVMGFDALYVLVSTALIFTFGSIRVYQIPAVPLFLVQTALMVGCALLMFLSLLKKGRKQIHLLVLVGIVVGLFFRSLTEMMASIMDPNEFQNAKDAAIASFSSIDESALVITVVVTSALLILIIWRAHIWDLVALGQDLATALGVNYRREVLAMLSISSILVACATALVGPLMFFGLLIVNISVYAIGSAKVIHLVFGSCVIGICVLVGGQAILEHILHQGTILPVVIEFVGGILLLTMLIKNS